MLEEEEEKLKQLSEFKELEDLQKKTLTYEEYYNSHPQVEVQNLYGTGGLMGSSRKDTKYEDFIKEKASKYIFDNDLLD